jgi:hypothetical protein
MIETAVRMGQRYESEELLDTIMRHRAEFEAHIIVFFDRAGCSAQWKIPVWIHDSSSPDR